MSAPKLNAFFIVNVYFVFDPFIECFEFDLDGSSKLVSADGTAEGKVAVLLEALHANDVSTLEEDGTNQNFKANRATASCLI